MVGCVLNISSLESWYYADVVRHPAQTQISVPGQATRSWFKSEQWDVSNFTEETWKFLDATRLTAPNGM